MKTIELKNEKVVITLNHSEVVNICFALACRCTKLSKKLLEPNKSKDDLECLESVYKDTRTLYNSLSKYMF